MKWIITLVLATWPLVARAEPTGKCVSAHGEPTLEAFTRALVAALDGQAEPALARLAIDECAFVRAQLELGHDDAERLAKVTRGDQLADTLRRHRKDDRLPRDARLIEPVEIDGKRVAAGFTSP